ncbi:MAG: FtsP/CotA-like multicopper oxidase with cupredoxin domain, partial [Kiritimatiellia bacterium]
MIARLALLSVLPALLVACTPDEPEAAVEVPKPTVWGPQALVDQDPDFDVVEVVLTADETTVDWMDGGSTPVWSYNGVVPGPIIQAWVGDTVRVIFTNNLDEPTTIHWHGLRIDNLMDGVPAVQDPVQPGETFTYEFVVPDAGSYWYHPHVRSDIQVESGLQGTLVVHEREPLAYDMDRYFVIDDVLLTDSGQPYAFRPMSHMT